MQSLKLTTHWFAVYYEYCNVITPPHTNEVVIYKFILSSEEINSNGGFSFIKRLLDFNQGMSIWDRLLPSARNSRYSTSCIIRNLVGIQTAGGCDYADIEKFRDDFLFRELAGGKVPSEESFRQRLDRLASRLAACVEAVDGCVAAQIASARLTPLGICGMKMLPVDIDVSVFEDKASHKEGVGPSYRNVDGYAPIFCYAGVEGFMVAAELRPGRQHSENGAVEFLERCVGILLRAGYSPRELLVRVDSGHDAGDFIRKLENLGVRYIVKRNLRRESPEQLLDSIRYFDRPERPRRGKTVFRGIRSDRRPAGYTDGERFGGFMAVEGVERKIDRDGQRLLIPEVEVDSWWTNLPLGVRECVGLYHDHGTSEQFHSELKGDMGMELLPSGSMATNSLVLSVAAISFNCLRMVGQLALARMARPKPSRELPLRMRLRTVLLDFIKVGCKIARHAGQTLLKFGRNCYYFAIMKEIYANC